MSSNSGAGSEPAGNTPPRRTPTDSSYYDFHGTPSDRSGNGQTWMYARDARAQQAGASPQAARPYPSYFGNKDQTPVTLTTAAEAIPHPSGRTTQGWLHQPLIPNQTTMFNPGQNMPGAVRSVYPPSDPSTFDVIYHSGVRREFNNATYHPANR
ncbi:hypothetical protein VFPPC_02304 [Pochonia chlamydosporia 170]|uniref:Uncharacterized protein n=1 Tax=Pochonia chlamydosporia 170 TaxID=1380566 RepID=A0A179FWG0_METCM|nr:hypothetical protein VFPPC_02304 [Pochonia chlamydosporia 170]OAQ69707.1 hypothetical protein VFPPC_02304 [Pochonia chlamydosporia 170]